MSKTETENTKDTKTSLKEQAAQAHSANQSQSAKSDKKTENSNTEQKQMHSSKASESPNTAKTANAEQSAATSQSANTGQSANTAKSANSAQTTHKAESGYKPSQPSSKKIKKSTYAISIFAAALGGGCVALLGTMGLQKAGVNLAIVSPLPAQQKTSLDAKQKAIEANLDAVFAQKSQQLANQANAAQQTLQNFAPEQNISSEINKLFAQKIDMLNAQIAQAKQSLQESANQQAQTSHIQDREKLEATLGALVAVQDQLAHLTTLQNADRQSLAQLKDNLNTTQADSKNILDQIAYFKSNIQNLAANQQQTYNKTLILLGLQNLQSAFDRGMPYETELKSFEQALNTVSNNNATRSFQAAFALNSDQAAFLSNLSQYQASGLPNKAWLAQDFTQFVDSLSAQNVTTSQESGFWNTVQRRLSGWITIRPQGQASGATAAAILARMETAIGKGDYETALKEAQTLPPDLQNKIQKYTDIMQISLKADIFFKHMAEAIFSANPAPIDSSSDMALHASTPEPNAQPQNPMQDADKNMPSVAPSQFITPPKGDAPTAP